MLSVKIICMGKLRDSFNRDAMDEYTKRLRALCKLEVIELPESRLPENPSDAEIEKALHEEGDRILQKAEGKLVAMCIEGKAVDSVELGDILKGAMDSPGKISFVIGSSFGLSDSVKDKSQKISMSKMTFPHGLARVMLTEQIYRGFQIINGSKYHK